MGRYIGTQTLRAYLSPAGNLGTTENALLESCIVRAESAIDSYTRRNFAGTAGTAQYSRYYTDRVRNNAFYLDRDLHTLSTLITGISQNIPLGSIWLEPAGQPPPYRIIRLHSSYVYSWNTDQDMLIAGTWGYGTVPPDDVIQATVRAAAYYYRGKDSGFGPTDTTGFTEAGEQAFAKSLPDDVRWILSPYRSRSGGII